MSGQASSRLLDHCDLDEAFGVGVIVPTQPPAARQPAKDPLYHPAAGQDVEACAVGAVFDDIETMDNEHAEPRGDEAPRLTAISAGVYLRTGLPAGLLVAAPITGHE